MSKQYERGRCRRRIGLWRLGAVAALTASSLTMLAAQATAPQSFSGSWTLQESTGDLPDQAVRAFDGSAVSSATIEIEQAGGVTTVRRTAPRPMLLRVLLLQGSEPQAAGIQDAVLTGHARWRDRTLVTQGEVTIKRGFLKRRVPYVEEWRLAERHEALTVVLRVETPQGVKRRTQIFVRPDREKIFHP